MLLCLQPRLSCRQHVTSLTGTARRIIDNQFSHYAAQQNLYAALLQDKYALRVSSMWLAQFHPQQHDYQMRRVPYFLPVARRMLDMCAVAAD